MKSSSLPPNKQSSIDINWDFSNIDNFLEQGFSDFELEYLCKNTSHKEFPYQNPPFTYFWQSEVYGFGRCLRLMLNWPIYLPLPFHIDHGGDPAFDIFEHDVKSPSKYHICYFDSKYSNLRDNYKSKLPIRILHPYVFYRRKVGYSLSPVADGCILFVPSSIPGIVTDNVIDSVQSAISEIKSFSNNSLKIALCLHFHDVNCGLHHELRRFRLPIFTCGHPHCQLFVDRFYKIVCNYSYASTPNPMSALYYCTELGLSPLVVGVKTVKTNISCDEMTLGDLETGYSETQQLIYSREYRIFKNISNHQAIIDWCSRVLALDVDPYHLQRYKNIFFFELIRLLPIVLINKFNSLLSRHFK